MGHRGLGASEQMRNLGFRLGSVRIWGSCF